ncbi:MAG: hypothetical protein J3K34DRAFT_522340 [Monoraphidium minutum]|nr:MAG: hypothetical protein J3K34DRAFT_522340 [Monoraphidium minutum]
MPGDTKETCDVLYGTLKLHDGALKPADLAPLGVTGGGGDGAAAGRAARDAPGWEQHLDETFVRIDAWSLWIAAFNLWLTGSHSSVFVEGARAERAMRGWLSAIALATVAARLLLWRAPRRYGAARTALAVAQRLHRAAWVLAWHCLVGPAGWQEFFRRRAEGGVRGAAAVGSALAIVAMMWVMQALWFPLRLRLAAPLQAAACAAGCWCMRSLACHVARDPALLQGARRACRAAGGAKALAAALAGSAAPAVAPWEAACERAPMELLIPLASALGFFLPLYITYAARLALESRFKTECGADEARRSDGERAAAERERGALAPPRRPLPALPRAPLPAPAAHLGSALCVALASFAAAEATAALGRPYQC